MPGAPDGGAAGEMHLLTDEALYAAVQRGDRSALTELVGRYHAVLLKFLYRMTNDSSAAEDLVQEAFLRMITFRGKTPSRFRPWAYTVAANLARDSFRSAAYKREIQEAFDGCDESLDPLVASAEDMAFRRGSNQQVGALLQRLPALQREVIVLRFYHELSLEETAQICGTPLGTVKSRLYQGLRHLKTMLEREEREAYEQTI
jgi:RNA polymerase sigma-70 factor, ECF subfamily